MPAIRRLAAILAADVAGYSRLMGQDEAGTAQALREHRAAADPLVANHGGRIVKTTGDEVLIEFGSVVAAVECALALQQLTAERNAEIASERRMEWRIGIHLGDVLVEGDDILGDGVNIAARLERIAESGRICISEDAFRQVRGKIDAEFTDIGEQSLKNIAQPLRVYRAGRKGPTLTLPRERQGCPEKIRGPSLRKFVCEISRNRSLLTLAPRRPGGEGRVRAADEPVRDTTHLTLPLRGPLPLPPDGRRGALADRMTEVCGWRNDELPIVFVSPDSPARAGEGSAPGARVGAAEPPQLALPDKPSIAVLPFANMSGDPEQEYFADGMVEEIITALSRIRWLFVIARNSTFTYKGRAVDVKQVGRDMGVRYVLEGSVRKAGNRVRITAQLIEAETAAHLWADRFDGSLESGG